MNKVLFSLILCTVKRDQAVREFLQSLADQRNAPPFEVVMIDQNPDDRLLPIIAEFTDCFPIRRITAKPGLSSARNTGLPNVEGEIVAFPDDDCTNPPDLLRQIADYLAARPELDGMSTLLTDKADRLSGCFMFRKPEMINRKNVWRCAVSSVVFFRKSAVRDQRFDENLGIGSGSFYGSGEETDFILYLLEQGKKLAFCPEYRIFHPVYNGPWSVKRGFRYGCGMGRVLQKHHYTILHVLYYAGLQGVRMIQSFFTFRFGKMCYHAAMGCGRICGFIASLFGKQR